MRELPSGTVTLLFTDIEGSTRLLRQLGREAYVRALTEHRRLLREAFTRHGGVEVEMQGDSFHFAFPFAREAVAAAVAGQRALHEHRWETQPVSVRVGLHTGEPMQADGLYAGLDVHWAARVMSAGHGGQVLLSQRTAELVGGELAAGITIRDLGEHRLKDITTPQRLFQAVDDELPADFPPLKTITDRNLPRPASAFIGRDRELADVLARIEGGARLLTLTGPGGSGKTRLALEAAASLVSEYEEGLVWIGLAALRDPGLVTQTIAQTLGAKDELTAHIGNRKLLLLLDNLEQVIDAAPELARVLEYCPNLKLLVTSRELLRVQGEVEYPVPPLTEPDAVALFCERAHAEPSDDISELCRRLDALPLAVELAAARAKALSPAQILHRLSHSLDLLRGGRDADPRQQTLAATIQWSYDLLTTGEQRLFRSLAIFVGGCSLEAAEEVSGAELETLQSLTEKSLVRFSGERFWMLETIRAYARERLDESGDAHEAASARNAYLVELARRGPAESAVYMQREWADQFEAERDNVRAAMAWSVSEGRAEDAYRLATAYGSLCAFRGPLSEGRSWLDSVLQQDGVAPALRQRALRSAASLASRQRDVDAAVPLAEESLAIARAFGDPNLIGQALGMLGTVVGMTMDLERAEALHREALTMLSTSGDERWVREAMGMLGWVAIARRNYPEAHALCEEALRLSREAGDLRGISLSGGNLGHVLAEEGRLAEALALQREVVLIARDSLDLTALSSTLVEIALVAIARRDYEPAAVLAGAAGVLLESVEFTLDDVLRTSYDESFGALQAALGPDRLATAIARGRELKLDEIFAYAVEFIDSSE